MKGILGFFLLCITVAGVLAACGGGSSSSSTVSTPASVTGVATPQGVSVVTAN